MADKKAKKRNVKLAPKKERVSFKGVLKAVRLMFITCLIVSAVGVSGYYGSQAFKQFMSKPISRVLIEGDFHYINKDVVVSIINEHMQGSFIRESLGEMQQQIQANPWIDSVTLRRQWPDQLQVKIIEQKPIARWGESGFVNYRGELIEVENAEMIQNFPVLIGKEASAKKIMKQYQILSQVINPYEIRIVELEESQLGVWTVQLENGWKVLLGRADPAKKIQMVMQMLAEKKIQRQDEISVIDMRYENGLAIRWKVLEQHANRPLNDKPAKVEQNI